MWIRLLGISGLVKLRTDADGVVLYGKKLAKSSAVKEVAAERIECFEEFTFF